LLFRNAHITKSSFERLGEGFEFFFPLTDSDPELRSRGTERMSIRRTLPRNFWSFDCRRRKFDFRFVSLLLHTFAFVPSSIHFSFCFVVINGKCSELSLKFTTRGLSHFGKTPTVLSSNSKGSIFETTSVMTSVAALNIFSSDMTEPKNRRVRCKFGRGTHLILESSIDSTSDKQHKSLFSFYVLLFFFRIVFSVLRSLFLSSSTSL
jgi:hypothetical protein